MLGIEVDRARERVGDHQRRRGEVVGAHERVDAPLEVPVAREHGGRDQLAARDRLRYRLGERAAVADAVVDPHGAGNERMHTLDRQVEDFPPAGPAALEHLQRHRRQGRRVLLDAVALFGWCLGSGAQRGEPVARADLPESFDRRRKAAALAVERPELAIVGRGQTVEAVLPHQERVVGIHDGFALAECHAGHFAGLAEP